MPIRLLRLRLLTTLHRALLDMPLSDDIQWDWGELSRLVLDDPPIDQELFEVVPKLAICPTLPSWDLGPWASNTHYRNLEPETFYSAGVGNFGPLELTYLTANARLSNESWNVPFPSEAGSELPTGFVHKDANIGDHVLGEPFHEQQNEDMLNLGTQFPL